MPVHLLCQKGACHDFASGMLFFFIQPAAFRDIPPGTHAGDAGVQTFTCGQVQVMVEPCAGHFHLTPIRQRRLCVQKRCKVDNIESPENGFQPAQFIFTQISCIQLCSSAYIVDIGKKRGILRFYHNIGTIVLELFVHFFLDAQNHIEHARSQRCAKRNGQCDQEHLALLMKKHTANHPEQHSKAPPYLNSFSPATISSSRNTRFPSLTS